MLSNGKDNVYCHIFQINRLFINNKRREGINVTSQRVGTQWLTQALAEKTAAPTAGSGLSTFVSYLLLESIITEPMEL